MIYQELIDILAGLNRLSDPHDITVEIKGHIEPPLAGACETLADGEYLDPNQELTPEMFTALIYDLWQGQKQLGLMIDHLRKQLNHKELSK